MRGSSSRPLSAPPLIGAWLSRLCARRLGDNASSSFVDLEATAGWLHAATAQRLLHLG